MNSQEILNAVARLAHSQGCYGRLYEILVEDPETLQSLVDQNFKSTLDMIMFLES